MPAAGDHEAQHRAFIQKLQARNQVKKEQQELKEQSEADRLRREQNFSVCFSGANARKTPSQGRSRRGSSFGQERGAGGWRQWEEHTVEIQGAGGEVFALRPTGERRSASLTSTRLGLSTAQATGGRPPGDGEAEGALLRAKLVIEAEGASLRATGGVAEPTPLPLSVTQRELKELLSEFGESNRELLAELTEPPAEEGGDDATPAAAEEAGEGQQPATPGEEEECNAPAPASPVGEGAAAAERPLVSSPTSSMVLAEAEEVLMQPPTAVELADRISRLPQLWQGKILRLLEEAEASMGAPSSSLGRTADDQAPCAPSSDVTPASG